MPSSPGVCGLFQQRQRWQTVRARATGASIYPVQPWTIGFGGVGAWFLKDEADCVKEASLSNERPRTRFATANCSGGVCLRHSAVRLCSRKSSVGARTPLCRACATLLSAHQPSALTCGLLALASPASHPNNTAFDPSCVPAVADARQGSPAQPRAYLRSAKLWDRAALRSVPGRELFSTSPPSAREKISTQQSVVLSMRISQRATLRVSPAPHRHRRAHLEILTPDTALAVRRTRTDSTCSMPGSGM